jgi:hypothetical protein
MAAIPFQNFGVDQIITFTGINLKTGEEEEIICRVKVVSENHDGYAFYILTPLDGINKKAIWNTSNSSTDVVQLVQSSKTKSKAGQENYRIPYVNMLTINKAHVLFLTKVTTDAEGEQDLDRKLVEGGSKYRSRRNRSRQNKLRRTRSMR